MERYRFAMFERNGETSVFSIDGSVVFVRDKVSHYWELRREIEKCLPRILGHACATLSKDDFTRFCAEIPISAKIDSHRPIMLEILPLEEARSDHQNTDWPDPLSRDRNTAIEIVGHYWDLDDLIWKSIMPVLEDAQLALEEDYFDLFCAECGIYNEVSANGEIEFELLPPAKPDHVANSSEDPAVAA